jgi:hypothetical protein
LRSWIRKNPNYLDVVHLDGHELDGLDEGGGVGAEAAAARRLGERHRREPGPTEKSRRLSLVQADMGNMLA